jgi:FlgD Ig-like domain
VSVSAGSFNQIAFSPSKEKEDTMKRALLLVLLAGVIATPLQAETRNPAGICIISSAVQDTNRWEIWQDNRGRFVASQPGSNPGGFWPKHSGHNYFFGAGIWVGAIDTSRTPPDTQVTWGYNPNSGAAEFAPSMPNGDTAGALTDSLARVYRSDIPRDTAQWPLRDSTGRAVYVSHQDLWTIFNDVNPIFLAAPDSSIGIQVIRRSYAWNSPGPWGDIVKMEHEVKNVTGRWLGRPRTLTNVIVSLCVDADIGNESGTNANDLVYLDRTPGNPYPNLAVQYQLTPEPGWGTPPYFVGMKFVSGPVNNTGDTLRIRSQPGYGYPEYDHDVLPGQPLGMTSFQLFTIAMDPSLPGQRYLISTGRDYRNPGVYNAYQKDTLGGGDKRFLLSCGPFTLPNDSSVTLVAHIIGGTDSLDLIRKAELLGIESPPGPVSQRPSGVALYPCVPNPSSGSCLIRYALPEPTFVILRIYDVCGQLVRELDGEKKSAGFHEARWSGRDDLGRTVPAGVYFYRLEAGGFSQARSVILLR